MECIHIPASARLRPSPDSPFRRASHPSTRHLLFIFFICLSAMQIKQRMFLVHHVRKGTLRSFCLSLSPLPSPSLSFFLYLSLPPSPSPSLSLSLLSFSLRRIKVPLISLSVKGGVSSSYFRAFLSQIRKYRTQKRSVAQPTLPSLSLFLLLSRTLLLSSPPVISRSARNVFTKLRDS